VSPEGLQNLTLNLLVSNLGKLKTLRAKEVPASSFISNKRIHGRLFHFLKALTVKFVKGTKIIVDANNENSFSSIKPWTLDT